MSWYDALPDPLPTDAHRWASPEFREEVAVWVGEVAAPVLAMEQVKLRPWATVWRVDTTAGVFFAKQNCRAQAFEAALVAELAQWVPHRIVPVRGTDPDRDLLLTYDQGPVLGEQAGDDLDEWCRRRGGRRGPAASGGAVRRPDGRPGPDHHGDRGRAVVRGGAGPSSCTPSRMAIRGGSPPRTRPPSGATHP